MEHENLIYLAALNNLFLYKPGVAKKLVETAGSAKEAFSLSRKDYQCLTKSSTYPQTSLLDESYEEIEWARKEGLEILSYTHPDFPQKLLECEDHPILLFSRGKIQFNGQKVVSVVGTRRATLYGTSSCELIIEEISQLVPDVIIVSGMAYGADITAHKAALAHNLQTAAILATGLKDIYPVAHLSHARQIAAKGALIAEYPFTKIGYKYNFIRRNRIIAGICDSLIVIESAGKGGAIITAKLANSYSREVFALPGRVSDPMSYGCNMLISENRARLFCNVDEFAKEMNWKCKKGKRNNTRQPLLFPGLSKEKEKILLALKSHNELNIDTIAQLTLLNVREISILLTELEIENRIICAPGGFFSLK